MDLGDEQEDWWGENLSGCGAECYWGDSLDREDESQRLSETRRDLVDKRKALALRKSKRRKRGKKGKGSVKNRGMGKDANYNSTGSVVGDMNVHAGSIQFDSVRSPDLENRHHDKYSLGLCEGFVFFYFECKTCTDEQLSAFNHQSMSSNDA